MARNPTKYLAPYHPRIEAIRARAAIRPDVLIQSKFWVPKDETGEPVPFKFTWAQWQAWNAYLEVKRSGQPIRLWVLKARREGLTSLFSAIAAANAWSMDNRRVGIIAHNDDRAKRILAMCKGYYKRLPPFMRLPLSKDATAGLKYAQHDSELVIGTCTKPEKVRGDGLHDAILSEGPYYKQLFNKVLTEISTTIAPAAGTSIVVEGTGKARGSQAHKHWDQSKKGQTVFAPIFIPFHQDPTKLKLFDNEFRKDAVMGNMREVEPRIFEKLTFWDRKLKKDGWEDLYQSHLQRRKVMHPCPEGIPAEKMFWVYWQFLHRLQQDYAKFCYEFPMDDEEAWSSEGDNFFGENEIQALEFDDGYQAYGFNGRFINGFFESFEELERIPQLINDDRSEPYIKLWKSPTPGRQYVIGADSSLGEANSTFTAGYVIDMITRETMCMYHGRMRPDEHAYVMASLGKIYNNAEVAPEINPGGGGMSILTDLQRLGYFNIYIFRRYDTRQGSKLMNGLGWVTNSWSRPLILSELRKMVQDAGNGRFMDPGMFRDKALLGEMRSFHVNPENGRPEAAADSYDDRIVALSIAHRVAGDAVVGGKADIYMRYNQEHASHPLIETLERMEAQAESTDAAASAVAMLKYHDFERDEETGIMSFYDN